MAKTKEIIDTLANGKVTIGSWMQIPSADVAEIMGRAGYDWVAVDLEHGAFSRRLLPDIFRALELGGTVPVARVAQAGQKEIKQALDCGARGLIFPMIESAAQLKQAIDWAFYPPHGSRGVGYCRANLFGKDFDICSRRADELLIVAQIEHIDAVQSLDEILAVSGLHAIIVGPYDLSGSMGLTAQFDHPEFVEVLNRIREKTSRHGIPMGLHIVQPDEKLLREKIAEGYQFIAYSIDAVFLYNSGECPVL